MKYTIEPNEQAQAGLDYQASITGESVKDMIQRRVSEIGISFSHDCKRAKAQELIAKIQDSPADYEAAIVSTWEAKVAVEAVES